MFIKIYGARGAIPTPGIQYSEYGGNTSCIQIVDEKTLDYIILDGGTGMKSLGTDLLTSDIRESIILLTHFHWDHILGIPFFKPFYIPDLTASLSSNHTELDKLY